MQLSTYLYIWRLPLGLRVRLLSQKIEQHFERSKPTPFASARLFQRRAPGLLSVQIDLPQAQHVREVARLLGWHRRYR